MKHCRNLHLRFSWLFVMSFSLPCNQCFSRATALAMARTSASFQSRLCKPLRNSMKGCVTVQYLTSVPAIQCRIIGGLFNCFQIESNADIGNRLGMKTNQTPIALEHTLIRSSSTSVRVIAPSLGKASRQSW